MFFPAIFTLSTLIGLLTTFVGIINRDDDITIYGLVWWFFSLTCLAITGVFV